MSRRPRYARSMIDLGSLDDLLEPRCRSSSTARSPSFANSNSHDACRGQSPVCRAA